METPWDNVNGIGIYNFDEAAGHYKREAGEVILFQKLNFFSYSGWYIGSSENSVGILNPVLSIFFIRKFFML